MDRREFIQLIGALPLTHAASGFSRANYSKIVYPGKNGKLIYTPDTLGNTIPDFSNCGYMGGGVRLPDVTVRAELAAGESDARERIQAAIDKISKMPLNTRGFRGALLLKKGEHKVGGTIRISASGVVLRGEGDGENGTRLVATQKKQHSLIEIKGQSFGEIATTAYRILDSYVPVGSHSLKLDSTKGLRVGDNIVVRRIGNKEWISEIRMDRITPRPTGGTKQWEPFNLDYDRVITGIDGDRITIDAPIVCAIERRWGGGEVIAIDNSERIRHVGVEDLRGVSEFDRTVTAEHGKEKTRYFSDENHAWDFINISAAENVWVKNISAYHFGYSAVNIGKAKWITVQDSKCLDMVSQITGGRRYSFNVDGQLNLVLRCEASSGRHDFVVGGRVCGPNAFVHCSATNTFASSEPHHRWSTGGLFDNVKAPLAIQDRQYFGSGHGWSGANYVAWNCEGPLVCQKPPTAQNWAIGHVGEKQAGAFAPREDGFWESLGSHVEPESLYFQQLKDRRGNRAVNNVS
ncbi:MAG TPA: hypothetical protein VJL58_07265 [Pyrinomonadaceae bacterium]|nr:hypothetical protein [Pyrinomonadaceae bacterium]